MGRERFSPGVRNEVRDEQGDRCAICGEKGHLSIHHKQPLSKGGKSTIDNAVGLCRGDGTNNCHDMIDYMTIREGESWEEIMQEGVFYYPRKK